MNLVERYIAAVQRELPEKKRDEIGRELKANILDELDAIKSEQSQLTDQEIARVLKKLGHPREVAHQFVPPSPFIHTAYMGLYKNTLGLVLGLLFVLQVFSSAMAWTSHDTFSIFRFMLSVLQGFLEQGYFAFTAITITYWLMSRQQKQPTLACSKSWQPTELPAVGPAWQHIKLHDIFMNLASYIFFLVVIWSPHSMLFSAQALAAFYWATPVILLGMVASVWQLRTRLWSQKSLFLNAVVNVLLGGIALYTARLNPLLLHQAEAASGLFSVAQLERSATVFLVVVGLLMFFEGLRDGKRARVLT
ncbi:hypothetical protein CWE15_06730 [Aliidiomarina taiwanensis]|uniref:Uncharacterized protein n=2 Tax=Aliidiomarina taiwanensis TaxID=946228 RepID=A0A432X1M8_9GAMM|nr:hypothetical protein CWE15_06730 [Aliidiomarina taiwanensis]